MEDWRTIADPERRLALFADDPAEPMPLRRQATDLLSRVRQKPRGFPPHAVRQLGMLMLVP